MNLKVQEEAHVLDYGPILIWMMFLFRRKWTELNVICQQSHLSLKSIFFVFSNTSHGSFQLSEILPLVCRFAWGLFKKLVTPWEPMSQNRGVMCNRSNSNDSTNSTDSNGLLLFNFFSSWTPFPDDSYGLNLFAVRLMKISSSTSDSNGLHWTP